MNAREIITSKRGATAVVVAVVLTILVSITALVIDVGYGLVVRNELQNAADAGALAGARELGKTYKGMKCKCHMTYYFSNTDREAIIRAVQEVAQQNYADGKPVIINTKDIKIGTWDPATKTLQVTDSQPDAVSIIARRDGNSSDGPITTFFARIFGADTVNVSAKATAALTDIGKVGRHRMRSTLCICSQWFDGKSCCKGDTVSVQFSNTCSGDAGTGWTTFDDDRLANSSTLNDIHENLLQGTYKHKTPEATAGETKFNLVTGNVSTSALNSFKQLYDDKTYDADNKYKDPVTGEVKGWEVLVPVLDANSSGMVVGFATVAITEVSSKRVKGNVLWGCFGDGHGCGHKNKYGTKGTIPALVQ